MQWLPIYIIKIPNSNRNPGLAKSLNTLGLKFQIQEAVVGNKLTSVQLVKNVNLRGCDARLGYKISKSLIGCGLSHRETYKKFLENGSDWALILEEDVIIEDFNFSELFQALEICNTTPTIIQLFTRSSRIMDEKSIVKLGSGTRIIFNFKPRLVGSGTSAYFINRLAAQKALIDKKLDGAPDWPRWAQGVSQKGIYPWMVCESEIGSTITLSSISHMSNLRRRLLQLTGIHYLTYFQEYSSPIAYFKEEISPYLLYLYWRLRGSHYYLNDVAGPQTF
jgi:hypothetical protein